MAPCIKVASNDITLYKTLWQTGIRRALAISPLYYVYKVKGMPPSWIAVVQACAQAGEMPI